MPKTYVGDDAMERALRVAKSVLSRCELAEVLRRAGYHVIEQAEYDPTGRFRIDCHVELHTKTITINKRLRCDARRA